MLKQQTYGNCLHFTCTYIAEPKSHTILIHKNIKPSLDFKITRVNMLHYKNDITPHRYYTQLKKMYRPTH